MLEFLAAKRSTAGASGSSASAEAVPSHSAPRDEQLASTPLSGPGWLGDVMLRVPEAACPTDLAGLRRQLEHGGATGRADFAGLQLDELRVVWPCLAGLSDIFLAELARPQGTSTRTARRSTEQAAGGGAEVPAGPLPCRRDANTRRAVCALASLAAARTQPLELDPTKLAELIVSLAKVPPESVHAELQRRRGIPEGAPWERAASWNIKDAISGQAEAQCELVWREFQSWQKSALKYVSPVRLWGAMAVKMQCAPWPPSDCVLGAFAVAVQHGPTLMKYCSQIRSVLRLVRIPLGSLDDTSLLARGAAKSAKQSRFCPRASAKQTRALANHFRRLGDPEVADSFVVARHFCLRYGSELVPLHSNNSHSKVVFRQIGSRWEATVHLHHRKMYRQSVEVIRRCICELQTPDLCGVCALRRQPEEGRKFPSITYSSALAILKTGCLALNFERAAEWGTHAFRRGWADEVLAQGGVPAMFHTGGWRGLAAFGYASARTRAAIQAAEWIIEYSDSSCPEDD